MLSLVSRNECCMPRLSVPNAAAGARTAPETQGRQRVRKIELRSTEVRTEAARSVAGPAPNAEALRGERAVRTERRAGTPLLSSEIIV